MRKPTWSIQRGNCLDFLRSLPDGSVHCCPTSPPYWALRSYLPADHPDKLLELGLEPTVQEWVGNLTEVFGEVRRVLHPSGILWLNVGDTWCGHQSGGLKVKDLALAPHRLAIALQDAGWWVRQEVIWHKPNGLPEPDRGRPGRDHETLWMLTKSAKCFYDSEPVRVLTGNEATPEEHAAALGTNRGADADRYGQGYRKTSKTLTHPAGALLRSVWSIPTEPSPYRHFATFPTALVRICVLSSASEGGCCPACLAPRRRLVEKGSPDQAKRKRHRTTVGWEPTCSCSPQDPIPCTVLDPFTGVGTVGLVCRQLGRSFVGCELNDDYHAWATERVQAAYSGLTVEEHRAGQLTIFEEAL